MCGCLVLKGCFPCLSLVPFPKCCCTQGNGDGMRRPGLDPQSYLQRWFLFLFSPSFPREGHGVRQISWEMSQGCLLLRGLAAFAARVTVSDTAATSSAHYWSLSQSLTSQQRLLHSLVRDRKSFQSQFKAPYLGEEKKKIAKQTTPQWKFA